MRAEPAIPGRISPPIAKRPENRPFEGRAFAQIHPRHPQQHFHRARSVTQATATSYADLSGADLNDADLKAADLTDAVLNGAHLQRATLTGANLTYASLRGADLYKAELSDTNMRRADLHGAVLREARLLEASLLGTILDQANFDGAAFGGTVIAAVMSGCEGLDNIVHLQPSTLSPEMLLREALPKSFLRGCGVPDVLIDNLDSLRAAQEPFQYNSCFISYSTKDEAFCNRLHARMQDAHLRVWFAPHDIRGGEKLEVQIDRAIQVHVGCCWCFRKTA